MTHETGLGVGKHVAPTNEDLLRCVQQVQERFLRKSEPTTATDPPYDRCALPGTTSVRERSLPRREREKEREKESRCVAHHAAGVAQSCRRTFAMHWLAV